MLHIERLFQSVPLLSLYLLHYQEEEVADRVVEDKVGTEGLGEFIDQGETMQSL